MQEPSADHEKLGDEFAAYLARPWATPDPADLFRRIRSIDPVFKGPANLWIITGYHAADQAYRSPKLSRALSAEQLIRPLAVPGQDPPEVVKAVEIVLSWPLHQDDPGHARLRRLAAPAFSPKAVSVLRSAITDFVNRRLDELEPQGSFDFLREFAYPLPEHMICAILGVQYSDMDQIVQLIDRVAGLNTIVGQTPDEMRRTAKQALVELVAFFRALIAERREQPGRELVDTLIAAEEEGDRLTEDELVGLLMQLIGAGHHTTAHALANVMLALLENPEQWMRLRSDPSLAPQVTEEILRYNPSSAGQPRIAVEDVEIGGKLIRAGEHVAIVLRAANRDPARFADPDQFVIGRESTKFHLGFGTGTHLCLGNWLARLEMNIAIELMARRLCNIELASANLDREHNQMAGLRSLPVRRTPRSNGAIEREHLSPP